MINTLYLPELREMLVEQKVEDMREFCNAMHPGVTAEFMEGLTADETWQIIRHAEQPLPAEIFRYCSEEKQVVILEHQDRMEMASLISELVPDDRVDILDAVSEDIVNDILERLPLEERRDILRLRAYREGTAGAVMTSDVAKLAENFTVPEALAELGRQAEELETIYYLYVVDDTDHLRGVVSARQLVTSMGRPDIRLSDLMEEDIVTAHVFEDQESVAHKVARYDLLAIPVLDDQNRMMGIITHDDIIDVVREEAEEDIQRIAAVNPLDESYLKTAVTTLSWKRGIWLTILFIAALLTAIALKQYDESIAEHTWLVLFIPLVISAGGNTGSQSSTLIIAAFASGDITLRDWSRVIRREICMGLIIGGFLSLIGYVVACFAAPNATLALIIPITLLLVILCGTFSGSALPLLFKQMGLDPALMSNPFVAGIVDILGIVIYMNVAHAFIY